MDPRTTLRNLVDAIEDRDYNDIVEAVNALLRYAHIRQDGCYLDILGDDGESLAWRDSSGRLIASSDLL